MHGRRPRWACARICKTQVARQTGERLGGSVALVAGFGKIALEFTGTGFEPNTLGLDLGGAAFRVTMGLMGGREGLLCGAPGTLTVLHQASGFGHCRARRLIIKVERVDTVVLDRHRFLKLTQPVALGEAKPCRRPGYGGRLEVHYRRLERQDPRPGRRRARFHNRLLLRPGQSPGHAIGCGGLQKFCQGVAFGGQAGQVLARLPQGGRAGPVPGLADGAEVSLRQIVIGLRFPDPGFSFADRRLGLGDTVEERFGIGNGTQKSPRFVFSSSSLASLLVAASMASAWR